MLSRLAVGRLLVGIGVLGLVSSLAGIVIGRALVTQTDLALERSLALTADTLVALEASITVAEETMVLVEDGLAQAETTTRDLVTTVEDGSQVLASTADLTEGRVAEGLESVEASLPALVEVASVIDTTLSALSAVPFGPSYDPEEPFDESVRQIQRSIAGVPDDLRAQAALIREAGVNLTDVGEGTEAIAADLAEIRLGLAGAVDVLSGYTVTATDASTLITETREGLGRQASMARLLVTLLGLAVAAGQIVPLGLGYALLRRPDAVPLLRPEVPASQMPPG